MGLGSGGLGFGMARSRTRGVSQTAMSKKAAPPEKKRYAKPLVTMFALYAVMSIMASGTPAFANMAALVWLCSSVAWIAYASNYNSTTWPPLKAVWDRAYLCNRCGHMFTVHGHGDI